MQLCPLNARNDRLKEMGGNERVKKREREKERVSERERERRDSYTDAHDHP